MAKGKSYRPRRSISKHLPSPISNYSMGDVDIESTTDPFYEGETVGQRWMNSDQTATSNLDVEEEVGSSPKSWPEFADRVVQGKITIPTRTVFYIMTLGWFAVASWLYVQDNQLERLQTGGGINQFFLKFGYYSAMYVVAVIIIAISSVFKAKQSKTV